MRVHHSLLFKDWGQWVCESCLPSNVLVTPPSSSHSLSSHGDKDPALADNSEQNYRDDEERELLMDIFRGVQYHSYLPGPQVTWKGGFTILDADQFIDGFQAYPPLRALHRTYQVSRKMPPVLQANLLPRLELWLDLFQDECLCDPKDVALYFFPDDNSARSRESQDWLFEAMDTQNSVLRVCFGGVEAMDVVELLIFTSKHLHLDSSETENFKLGDFLWGIFRDKDDRQADMEDTGSCTVDEVDMVGGKMVGMADVVVSKD
uniref:uncharacterized protein LOC101313607 isoform X1 n=1 Tax=Fragaria vesca subsp. vesca TaxID=101020 RepID=UPI0005CAE363|nr:PREDICTED: uncharacterized protein LOC101313607 isoform X1 [Fragaria vesca subsp. vesca]